MGWDGILLRSLVQLEHLAVLINTKVALTDSETNGLVAGSE